MHVWIVFQRHTDCCWAYTHWCAHFFRCWSTAAGDFQDVEIWIERENAETSEVECVAYYIDKHKEAVATRPMLPMPIHNRPDLEILAIPVEDAAALLRFLRSQIGGAHEQRKQMAVWCCDCCGKNPHTSITLENYQHLPHRTLSWIPSEFVLTALLISKPVWTKEWSQAEVALHPGRKVFIRDPYATSIQALYRLLKESHPHSIQSSCSIYQLDQQPVQADMDYPLTPEETTATAT